MIDNNNEINPTNVLKQLREGRPRMIEDTVQFNFALEVFEDVVFGDKSAVNIDDNSSYNEQLLNNSNLEFSQLQRTPINSTYEYSAELNIAGVVRNARVLPPDGKRVYLNIIDNKNLEVCLLFIIIS